MGETKGPSEEDLRIRYDAGEPVTRLTEVEESHRRANMSDGRRTIVRQARNEAQYFAKKREELGLMPEHSELEHIADEEEKKVKKIEETGNWV